MNFHKNILVGSLLLASANPVLAGEVKSEQSAALEVPPVAIVVNKDQKTKVVKVVGAKVVKEKRPFYLNPFKRIAHDSRMILTPLIENVGVPLKATEDNLKALQAPLHNLEEPLVGIKTTVGELREPLEDLKKPMTEVKQPIIELRKPIAALKQPISDLRKPIADLSKPIEQLNVPLDHLQRTMKSLPQPIENLVQPLDQLRKPLDDIAAPLSNLEPSVRNLAPPVHQLSDSVTQLHLEVASLSSEMKATRKSVLDICIYISLAIVLGCAMISGTLIWLIKHFARNYGLSPARAVRFVSNPDEVKHK
ncbi:hypothetical protein BH11CYA1_BH11CYA1_36390 [soil metagenome]